MLGYNKFKYLILLFLILTLLASAACSQADPYTLDATIAPHLNAPAASQDATTDQNTGPSAQTVQPGGAPTASVTPQASATPIPSLGADPDSLQGTTIQFWHPWSGETGQVAKDLVAEFNASNEWGVQVEMTAPGSLENLNSLMESALLTGQPPDLVAAYLFQALEWHNVHALTDLAPYIADPRIGWTSAEQADFYPAFWDSNQVGEQRLAVPALGSGQVLYYNQTWAEELGFSSPPRTPEQFREQVCAAARANNQDDVTDNDNTGGLALSTHYSPMSAWISAFGGQIFDPTKSTGKASPYNFAAPEVQKTFNFLRSLFDKGCAWLPEEPYPEQEFANRRSLVITGSPSNLPYQAQLIAQAGGDRWSVLPFPSESNQPAIGVYGPSYEIFTSTPERQLAAWLFARWMLSAQNQAVMAQASSGFPVIASALGYLTDTETGQPQWAESQQLLQYASPEPTARSWKTVRWALSDAATQLFRSYFKIEQVPELVKFLNQTAADLHSNPP